MREPTALTVRPPTSVARIARFRSRLDQSDERLRAAFARFRTAAQAVTPAAQISDNPLPWIMGGLALGIFIGWLSRSPRRGG